MESRARVSEQVGAATAEEVRRRKAGHTEPPRRPDELDAPRGEAGHSGLEIALKRVFDVAGATIAIVLLAPLWLLIALMIKIDSPGPIVFRQRRIGRSGEPFAMRKFRTMIDGADAHKLSLLHMNKAADGLFKIPEDPRVTRFGRFLRATSLDELPQLIHVLSGRMSLVGPRPLVPEEDVLIQGKFRCRLEMRPGMTGAWQVAGASKIPIAEMAKLDAAYVANWSLWGDLRLLIGTLPHVLLRRGI